MLKAPLPEPVIKGSIASPSAVAHIIVQKYINAVPLYRQEHEFAVNGFTLLRQTMANWLIYCAEHWLAPLYALMTAIMLKLEVLHADETVLQVLREPGRKARTESRTPWHCLGYVTYRDGRVSSVDEESIKDDLEKFVPDIGRGATEEFWRIHGTNAKFMEQDRL